MWLAACGGNGGGSSQVSSSSLSAPPGSSLSSVASSATNSSNQQSSIASSVASSSSVAHGLAQRPSNTTCLAPAPVTTGTNTTINWQAAFPSLPNMALAVGLVQIPGDNGFWYAIQQPGFVLRFANVSGVKSYVEALDIEDRVELTGSETGLLGIAFHPQFTTNPYVYLYYIGREPDGDLESRVARYTVAANGIINRDSEEILLRFTQPHDNHNGGQLAFGNDGYLYIASGDGGSGGDPDQYGQNRNTLLGKILRIDVDNTSAGRQYAIPSDNPFATSGGLPEIWAYGLRNPWRFSFDKDNNELWAGDVGQDDWEEINLITRGGNYGWGDMEGNSCYHERPDCSTANKILPVHVLNQEDGFCSVIGGFVYRGTQHPAAYGKYFFSDLCINSLRSITRESNGNYNVRNHGAMPIGVVSFAQDNQGELYALGHSGAGTQIQRMQASGGNLQPGTMANTLSATGCVNADNTKQAAAGMIPYTVSNELWSDGAAKERYLSLPNNTHIELTADGDFLFPIGSVLMKHFKLGEQFIETRLFARGELGWQGFSYEWLNDQTDALLLADGKDKTIDGIDWRYPSPGQCMTCHTRTANFSLGLESLQLNSNFYYSTTNILANQLDTLAHIDLFATDLTNAHKSQRLNGVADTEASLAQRARSYLHSNCSNCHRPDGPTPTMMDLRYLTSLQHTKTCNVQPTISDMGIGNALLIAPGEPERSVLLARMQVRGTNQMPPLGSHLVDANAVALISSWIDGLSACE